MTERPIRLLLVDDDEETYLIVRHLLSQAEGQQFEVDWAATYEDGLAIITKDCHDLYFVDYRLNSHDGLELLREAVRSGCRCPIIMLTGLGDRSVDVKAMKAGAADYLIKNNLDSAVMERTIRYALERQRLLDALQKQSQQLRRLTAEIGEAEERERRRIALLLHDQIQQMLVAVKMQLSTMDHQPPNRLRENLATSQRLLDEILAGCRTLAVEISPPVLHDVGLLAAFEWLARWMKQKYGLQVQIQIEDATEPACEGLRLFLFHAVRELLFNVVKHAQVDQARLVVRRAPQEQLQITVEDQGVGFDPDEPEQPGDMEAHLGLFRIRERLRMLNGQMEIHAAPGQGASVTIQVSLQNQQPLSLFRAGFI